MSGVQGFLPSTSHPPVQPYTLPKDLAGCTNGGCAIMAPVHDGAAVQTVVSEYLQGLSPWTTKSRGISISIIIGPCHFYLVPNDPNDLEVHDGGYRRRKNDHGSRIEDKGRGIEDPRGALLDRKGVRRNVERFDRCETMKMRLVQALASKSGPMPAILQC